MSNLRSRLQAALDGAYQLDRELGAGGMATVYLAHDLKHGRQVALKVMRPDVASSVGADRFLREIRVTAQLQHPHILPVFDSGHADDLLWYSMPYVVGETLRDRLEREGRFTLADATHIVHDIASALAYSHAQGVVHRDIKPENILLTPQHKALIADFGLATALEGDTPALTATGLGMGTPGYMAPEQMLGERPIRPQADVYAMGVIVHEMLAGTRPFPDSAPVVELARRMSEGAPSLASTRHDVPPALSSLIQRTLEVDPAKRPADAAAFVSLFDRAVATAVSPPPNAVHTAAPRRLSRSIGAACALLAIAATAWFALRDGDTAAPPADIAIAVLPFTTGASDTSQLYLGDGLAEDLTNRLARVPGLRLTPHTAALRFRNINSAPEVVASALGVTHVVLGRLLWTGDRARMSVELMNTSTRSQVWAEVRSVPRRELAAEVARLSHEIRRALVPTAGVVTTSDLVARDSQAYNYHLLGQHYFKTFSPDGLKRSVAYQDSAIARDPAFVAAWLGRANAMIAMASANGVLTGRDVLAPLREALDTALVMDPGSALAHAARGHAYTWFEWDWKAAAREFRQAVALSPREPLVLLRSSFLEMVQGRTDSALTLLATARQLDPTNTRTLAATATAFLYGRRYDEALTFARQAGELDPLFPPAKQFESLALSGLGRHAEAIRVARTAYLESRQPLLLSTLAVALASADSVLAARDALRELERVSDTTALDVSLILRPYAVLGDRDAALKWMDRAIAERSFVVSFAQVDPLLDSLRGDPRFQQALDRAGVPKIERVGRE